MPSCIMSVMTERRRKALKQIVVGVILLAVAGVSYWFGGDKEKAVMNFNECAEQGFAIMESYPRQCKTLDGQAFREDIGNELEKDNLIRIAEPRPNAVVSSPLAIKGMARGSWFFEASFPVRLFDGKGEMLAKGTAQAKVDPIRADGTSPASNGASWMTEEFVPFEVTLSFVVPSTPSGTLLLERDNPSGLPENEDALRVPVRFR